MGESARRICADGHVHLLLIPSLVEEVEEGLELAGLALVLGLERCDVRVPLLNPQLQLHARGVRALRVALRVEHLGGALGDLGVERGEVLVEHRELVLELSPRCPRRHRLEPERRSSPARARSTRRSRCRKKQRFFFETRVVRFLIIPS